MADLGPPAPLEHVREADEVAVDVGVGVIERGADARLSRQVDDAVEGRLGEERRRRTTVGEVDLYEPEPILPLDLREPVALQLQVAVRTYPVDADHLVAVSQQTPGYVKADEAGRTGDQDRERHRAACGLRG